MKKSISTLNKTLLKIMSCAVCSIFFQGVAFAGEITSVMYVQYDRQGSLIGVYNSNGGQILDQTWSAWGVRQDGDSKTLKERFDKGFPVFVGYRSQLQLIESDLTLIGGSTLYDPTLKRYLNPKGGDQNPFVFSGNNPLR